MNSVIEIEGLTKRFRKSAKPAVDDLSLTVKQGEIFGYLGPNGAGKTTTIRMLLDYIRPTAGRAEIFGLDCRQSSTAIHRRIGYVPGDLVLYDRLTGQELLEYFARLRGNVDWQYVSELSERFDTDLSVPIHSLSKGNKQKIGLLQACMCRPDLLILDEPTSGLDPLKQREFQLLMRELVAAGHTVFLSSHALAEVNQIADRVGIIRSGQLVIVDEIESLRERQAHQALHQVMITFADHVPLDELKKLPSSSDFEVTGKTVELKLKGSLNALIKLLAQHEIVDLVSLEANLDDIFFTYYQEQNQS